MRSKSVDTLRTLTVSAEADRDSEEQRQIDSEVLAMRHSGSSIQEIADSTGLTRYEVDQSVRAAIRQEREALESTPRSEILMESVAFLRRARDIQMSEAGELAMAGVKVDRKGNTVKKKLRLADRIALSRAKSNLVDRAVAFEKSVADLMVKTGVLPKQAEEIHVTMGATNTAFGALDGEEEIEVKRDGTDIRNRQELLGEIHSHLVVARRLKDSTVDVPVDAIIIEDDDTDEIT